MFVHLLTEKEFFDFKSQAALGPYARVGYSKVKEIAYTTSNIHDLEVKYKFSSNATKISVLKKSILRNGVIKELPAPKRLHSKVKLSAEKVKDLTSLQVYMQHDDARYMKSLLDAQK